MKLEEGGMDRPYEVKKHSETTIGRFTISQDLICINDKLYSYSYEMAEDCVCVLAFAKGKVVLIRQYRHSLNQWMWEFPAGGLNGESPEEAARRELKEETGYIADQLRSIGRYPISHGTSSSRAHLFVAQCGTNIGQSLEPAEFIEVVKVSRKQFEQMIADGSFVQMAGIVLWHMYRILNGIQQ